MPRLQGIIPALLTPFDEKGRLDEAGLVQLTEYQIANGVDGIYINGSTSESFLCDVSVRGRILRIVSETVDGRIPLVAQVGGLVYEESLRLIDIAADTGYDYISAVTPFYYKFSFEEVMSYYRRLYHPELPLILYFIPALTGLNLDFAQIGQLLAMDNVEGIKFTSGDMFLLERLRKEYADKTLLFGCDEVMFAGAFLDVDGFIGSTFNIIAPKAKKLREAVNHGRNAEARKLQSEMNDFISTALKAGLYPFLKEVLKNLGIPAGTCRHPIAPLTEKWKSVAAEESKQFKK